MKGEDAEDNWVKRKVENEGEEIDEDYQVKRKK